MTETEIETLLEELQVRLQAFAVCEIGRYHSLECSPQEELVFHFVLRGSGFLDCLHGRYQLHPSVMCVIPKRLAKSLTGLGPIQHVHAAEPACIMSNGIIPFRATDRSVDLLLGCAVLAAGGESYPSLFDDLEHPMIVQSHEPVLTGLFSALLKEIEAPGCGSRAMVTAVMQQLVVVMLRSHFRQTAAAPKAQPIGQSLQRVAMMISRDPAAAHSLSSLASEAAMSRARFIDHFAAAYGSTPMAFVQSARLASAAELLRTSEMPIKIVAAAVGYGSRSQFSTAFRKAYGRDPSAFRRAHQGSAGSSLAGGSDRSRSSNSGSPQYLSSSTLPHPASARR
jgi:AraC family transcriptional regulator, activator of mtrCDE